MMISEFILQRVPFQIPAPNRKTGTCQLQAGVRQGQVQGSARYYSFMESIDKTFYDLDTPGPLPTGIIKYREEHNDGSMVFDARISYRFLNKFSVALISNNIANLEYSLRPLKVESPRTIIIQLTAKL